MLNRDEINEIYKRNILSAEKILTKLDLRLYAANPDWVAVNHLGKSIIIPNLLMERLAVLFSFHWESIYELEEKLKSNETYLKDINKLISYSRKNNIPIHEEYLNYRDETKELIKCLKKEINKNLKYSIP